MRLRMSLGVRAAAGASLLVAGLAACNSDPIMCPDAVSMGSAISVEPFDSETGELLAGVASGRIEHGDYDEEMHRFEAPPPSWDGQPPAPPDVPRYLHGHGNGPGLYDVYVEVPGYESWSVQDVFVSSQECGGTVTVETRYFQPLLEPAS